MKREPARSGGAGRAEPRFTRSGRNCLLRRTPDSRGPRLDGEFLVDTLICGGAAAGDQTTPNIAFDGTNYLLVWTDQLGLNGKFSVRAARVSQEGRVLDENPIAIDTGTFDALNPVVAFDGTNYLVLWERTNAADEDIYAARVSRSGVVLDPQGIAVSTTTGNQGFANLAFGQSGYLAVWEDSRSGSYHPYALT